MTLLLLAAVLSMALVGLIRHVALRRGLLDRPNARSSHSVPTPRGGGLGLLLAVAALLLLPPLRMHLDLRAAAAILAVAATAYVGWRDDHGGLPVRVRLAVHLVSGVLVLPLAATIPLDGWFAIAAMGWWIFWVVSAINVVNFMDGIDGIIGTQLLVYGGFVALMGEEGGAARELGLVLAGSSLGFLTWNWSPARIFMGDVGSGALGVLLAVAGILLLREQQAHLVAAFLPLAPIFLDAAVTLAGRARRGERLSEAHRSHLYQRLANGGWGHARVTISYGLASIACGAAALRWPGAGVVLLVATVTVLCALGWAAALSLPRSGGPVLPGRPRADRDHVRADHRDMEIRDE